MSSTKKPSTKGKDQATQTKMGTAQKPVRHAPAMDPMHYAPGSSQHRLLLALWRRRQDGPVAAAMLAGEAGIVESLALDYLLFMASLCIVSRTLGGFVLQDKGYVMMMKEEGTRSRPRE